MSQKYCIYIMFDGNNELEIGGDCNDIDSIKNLNIFAYDHYQIGKYFIDTSKICYLTFWKIEDE